MDGVHPLVTLPAIGRNGPVAKGKVLGVTVPLHAVGVALRQGRTRRPSFGDGLGMTSSVRS